MENSPIFPVESPLSAREALDKDTKKDKDKKKQAATIHIPRLDVEKPAELSEKRHNAKKELGKELGGFSLAAWGEDAKPKNDATDTKEKPPLTEDKHYSPVAEAEAIAHEAVRAGQEAKDNDDEDETETKPSTETSDGHGVAVEGLDEEVEAGDPEESEPAEDTETTSEDGDADEEPTEDTAAKSASSGSAPPPPPSSSSGGSSGTGAPFSANPSSGYSSGTPPPPSPSGSGPSGSSGSTPPPPPPAAPAAAAPVGGFNTYPTPPVAAPNVMPMATNIEQRVIEKHDHFWLGVVTGGLYEHFKHKKREKKLKNELSAQKTELGKAANQQAHSEEELRKMRAQQLEQAAERKWQERHPQPVQQPEVQGNMPESGATKVGDIETPHTRRAAEIIAVPLQTSSEQAQATMFERPHEPGIPTHEGSVFAAEQLKTPEAKPAVPAPEDEPVQVDDTRRVEMSSWHRVEVDKATGKAVEDPSLAYGEAFQAERHQEVKAQDHASDDAAASGAGGSSIGLFGGVQATNGADGSSSSPYAPKSPSSQNKVEKTVRIGNKDVSSDSVSVVSIGVLVALVVLIIIIALN